MFSGEIIQSTKLVAERNFIYDISFVVAAKCQKKALWFWSQGRIVLRQKKCGPQNITQARKIQSPVFSSPVNHQPSSPMSA